MNPSSTATVRRLLLVALVAIGSLIGFAPSASASFSPPTPDIKIFGSTEVRTYSIDVNDTCRWQNGGGARSKMVGQSWRDWRCTVGGRDHSVNFTGYCRAKYGHGGGTHVTATHNTTGSWTATTWRCRVERPAGRMA